VKQFIYRYDDILTVGSY